jgi:hypothetical protein
VIHRSLTRPRALVVALAAVAAGCVTLTPEQQGVVAEVRRFADANAKAVEILMRVRGLTEARAVDVVVEYLRAAQRAVDRGGPVAAGHRQPVEEIADLLARFPGRR